MKKNKANMPLLEALIPIREGYKKISDINKDIENLSRKKEDISCDICAEFFNVQELCELKVEAVCKHTGSYDKRCRLVSCPLVSSVAYSAFHKPIDK